HGARDGDAWRRLSQGHDAAGDTSKSAGNNDLIAARVAWFHVGKAERCMAGRSNYCADAVVNLIRNEKIPVPIQRHAERFIKSSIGGGTAITGIAPETTGTHIFSRH